MMRSSLHLQLKLQEATALNEQGVASLSVCDSREALQSFQGALRALHEMERSLTDTEPSDNTAPTTSTCSNSDHVHWSSSASKIPHLQHDHHFFVYDRALLVQLVPTELTLSRVRFFGAAVCFNMGLAFHWTGNNNSNNASSRSTRAQRKAALCYAQSLQYLTLSITSNSCDNCDCDCDATMMTLLALNNQCQIQYQLRQRERLQLGLERIRKLSLAMLLLQCNNNRNGSKHEHEHEHGNGIITTSTTTTTTRIIGELMINVLVSTHPGVEVAAAA